MDLLRGGFATRPMEGEARRGRGGLPARGVEGEASRSGGWLARSRNPDPSEESMATEVEALIAGSLWKIEKAVGDVVEAFDVIMIIESMKMEIPVEAPCAGTIREIRVQEGDPVDEGAVLAVIE
jgi:biotin carboxyl carrier protein